MAIDKNSIKRVFCDFDGVIIESNAIKHKAFTDILDKLPKREEVLAYHRANNHLTRFEKFNHIARDILKLEQWQVQGKAWAEEFGVKIFDLLVNCAMVPGAKEFLQSSPWPIDLISATPQEELLKILQARGWATTFASVHGGPIDKAKVMKELLKKHGLSAAQVVFVGDSQEDFKSSVQAQVPFVGRQSEHPLNCPRSFKDWLQIGSYLGLKLEAKA